MGKIQDFIVKNVAGLTPAEIVALSKNKPRSQSIIRQIVARQLVRIRQDIQNWREAMDDAERDTSPDRTELMRVFKDVVLDPHLSSLIETRKNKLLSSNFWIEDKNGKKLDKVTDLFLKAWFFKFMELAQDSEYYGYTLIEFGPIVDNAFTAVKKVREEFVVPEKGIVKKELGLNSTNNRPDSAVIEYLKTPWSNWSIGIGDEFNLGILSKLTPSAIWKKNVLGSWSERAEIFGQPIRIGKTLLRDEARRLNMEAMMVNMGSAASATLDKDDDVEFIETSNTDAHKIYNELIDRCNSEMSKLILGGTATVDENAFVGSSEVQERNLLDFSTKDKRRMKFIVEDQLIPLMRLHKMIPNTPLFFTWDMEEKLSKTGKLAVFTGLSQAGFKVAKKDVEEEFNVKIEDPEPQPDFNPNPTEEEEKKDGASPKTKIEQLYGPELTA